MSLEIHGSIPGTGTPTRTPQPHRHMRTLALVSLVALSSLACRELSMGGASGDYSGIVAVMDPALWDQVDGEVQAALGPTMAAVRDEKTYTVTYQDPSLPEWRDVRRFRQLLLVGTGEEPWMREAVAHGDSASGGVGIRHVSDVWAKGQQVTLVIAGAATAADELRSHLAEINQTLDAQYRAWVKDQMLVAGVDSALADTLMATGRFQLLVPDAYSWSYQDSLYLFRGDDPEPSRLVRSVSVTWKSPIPPDMQPEGILAWRAEVIAPSSQGQDVDLSLVEAGPFEFRGRPAYQIRATWKNPPALAVPAAGPFMTRAVICPEQNRMYLVDAWLYAPDGDKYEHMIRLEAILDSFRCGPA